MKFCDLKYVLITCIALTFFIKVSHVVSYLSYSDNNIEFLSVNEDATEKEEKKVENEYLVNQFMVHDTINFPLQSSKQVIIPDYPFQKAYFPEVLTPPPSA